jgi:hypothetical protein
LRWSTIRCRYRLCSERASVDGGLRRQGGTTAPSPGRRGGLASCHRTGRPSRVISTWGKPCRPTHKRHSPRSGPPTLGKRTNWDVMTGETMRKKKPTPLHWR